MRLTKVHFGGLKLVTNRRVKPARTWESGGGISAMQKKPKRRARGFRLRQLLRLSQFQRERLYRFWDWLCRDYDYGTYFPRAPRFGGFLSERRKAERRKEFPEPLAPSPEARK